MLIVCCGVRQYHIVYVFVCEERERERERISSKSNNILTLILGTSLDQEQIVSFLCQILSALAYHHARGVVHEDLKPDNILMRDEQTLCLGDFGLASFSR